MPGARNQPPAEQEAFWLPPRKGLNSLFCNRRRLERRDFHRDLAENLDGSTDLHLLNKTNKENSIY